MIEPPGIPVQNFECHGGLRINLAPLILGYVILQWNFQEFQMKRNSDLQAIEEK